ncbi:MAG: HAMP domain-containing sensor histidine kinase [Sandaracinaceae bacterium]
MKLRTRLLVTVVGIAVPVVVGLALFAFGARRRGLVESTYEATVQHMEAGGRERCEARSQRREERVERRGLRGRERRSRRARRARFSRDRHAYDERFAPTSPDAPPVPTALREAIESGEVAAATWTEDPVHVTLAMRMPWDGPCAVLVIERDAGPMLGWRGLLQVVGLSALVAALTALAALFALGPVVRRLRLLTEAVRARAKEGYGDDVPVQGKDEVAELAAAFNDASAEIRERLRDLSARDEAMTRLLASTTHDIMVPLTVLQGHLSDAWSAARAGRPVGEASLGGALEEAHYLGNLMRNLSAAARMDAGEAMLTRHDFDLRDVVERVIARHRPIATERKITLERAVPEEPVIAHADSTLVEQALSNLVSNALRYNDPGGNVAVVLDLLPEGEGAFEVRVMDDGPGIPEEELERVAERRFRGGEARKRSPTGLGLGLHIVRDVAERHGWSLAFDSPEGGGLTVTLRS